MKVLFVGGGIETLPGVQRARESGYEVLVSDRNPEAPCMAAADGVFVADTYDAEATIAALERAGVRPDGVLCQATDVPLTVARIADHFGLPGLSLETAFLASDKLAMKDRLREHGIAIPDYWSIDSVEELEALRRRLDGTLVVKPVDSRGARGVVRLIDHISSDWAFRQARDYSPGRRVMAERYLEGPQVSSESMVTDGQTITPGFSDRNYDLLDSFAPYFIEDGGSLPSVLPLSVQEEMKTLVASAAAALGVDRGVVKGDLVYSQGRAWVIELATRLSGGYFCSHSIPVSTGVDLVGSAIRQALGLPVDPEALRTVREVAVCQRYLFPEPGRVMAIQGFDRARSMPGIFHAELRVSVGQMIAPVANHPGRAGVLMASAPDLATATARVEAARAAVGIVTKAGS